MLQTAGLKQNRSPAPCSGSRGSRGAVVVRLLVCSEGGCAGDVLCVSSVITVKKCGCHLLGSAQPQQARPRFRGAPKTSRESDLVVVDFGAPPGCGCVRRTQAQVRVSEGGKARSPRLTSAQITRDALPRVRFALGLAQSGSPSVGWSAFLASQARSCANLSRRHTH